MESRLKAITILREIHVLLAKTLARQKKWGKATEQAEIARQLETNNIVPPLMLAAIALKQSEQTNYLSLACINLLRANIIMQNMSEGDEQTKRAREWGLDTIIFYILNNQPDSAKDTVNRFM